MDNFLTATFEHRNNPTGAASTSSVATGIICTPLDPASRTPDQSYPIEKLFLLKECFTKYSAVKTGDFVVSGGKTYAVRAAWLWAAQGQMDAYYHLILEETLGS